MANQAISQLPVAIALIGNELVPIVQQGQTVRTTTGAIVTLAQSVAFPSLAFAAPLSRISNQVSLSSWTATVDQGVLYRQSSAALSSTAAGLVGQLLTGNGPSAAPSWLVAGTTGQLLLGTTTASAQWLSAGVNGQVLTGNTGSQPSWRSATALGIDLDVGSTAITGGVSGRVLYDNAGVLGELLTTGTGTTLVLNAGPIIGSPNITGGSLTASTVITPTITGGTWTSGALTASTIGTSTMVNSTINQSTLNNVTINTATITAATLNTPTINGGMTYGGTAVAAAPTGTGSLVLSNAPTFTGLISGVSLSLTSGAVIFSSTAIPAGGTTGTGYRFSSTGNYGLFPGSGAPTLSAAQGSLYARSDATTTASVYYNTNGTTGWNTLLSTGGPLGTPSSGNVSNLTGFPTATASTTFLTGANVAIGGATNLINTGSIGANTQVWQITGVMVGISTGAATVVTTDILHSGTGAVIASGEAVTPAANQSETITVTAIQILTAATTFTLRGYGTAANSFALRSTVSGSGTTDKMTSITAVRLA